MVWCLLISHVPFLYGLFDWHLVSPERQLQLRRACEIQTRLADLAYQEMQRNYKAMRKALFTFLINAADSEALLQRYADILSATCDIEATRLLIARIERGRSLFQGATDHARKMLHDQGELPVIDALTIDTDNKVIDTFSMPLLPIVPQEESEQFFAFMGHLTAWRQELQAFWRERGE